MDHLRRDSSRMATGIKPLTDTFEAMAHLCALSGIGSRSVEPDSLKPHFAGSRSSRSQRREGPVRTRLHRRSCQAVPTCASCSVTVAICVLTAPDQHRGKYTYRWHNKSGIRKVSSKPLLR